MATGPEPQPQPDDAVEILHRLESVLHDIQGEQRRQGDVLVKVQVDLGELRGRISQLPTLIQIVGAVLGLGGGLSWGTPDSRIFIRNSS